METSCMRGCKNLPANLPKHGRFPVTGNASTHTVLSSPPSATHNLCAALHVSTCINLWFTGCTRRYDHPTGVHRKLLPPRSADTRARVTVALFSHLNWKTQNHSCVVSHSSRFKEISSAGSFRIFVSHSRSFLLLHMGTGQITQMTDEVGGL